MLETAHRSLTELTPREVTVVELVAQGWSNREIAERLVVTVRTVESHIWAIMMKLCVCADDRVNRRVLLSRIWFEQRDRSAERWLSLERPEGLPERPLGARRYAHHAVATFDDQQFG